MTVTLTITIILSLSLTLTSTSTPHPSPLTAGPSPLIDERHLAVPNTVPNIPNVHRLILWMTTQRSSHTIHKIASPLPDLF